jgi:acyl-CoA synthetase (NDP forming)/RimJ/RimL family protein N-acetyltransferase
MTGSTPGPEDGLLVRDVLLRDGSSLRLQAPVSSDFQDIKEFYDGLSSESRYFRFHGYGRTDAVAKAEAEATGIDRLSLMARHDGRVVAVASYDGLREPGVAEVAFAVADDVQRRGIGTRMLEQLAEIAADRLIHRFDAEVMSANRPMLGVFENAGFAVRRQGSFGEMTVSLDITPTNASLERIDERDHFAVIASLRAILAPSSVAVMGATPDPRNGGRAVLESIIAAGFQGLVTPVHRDGGVVCSMPVVKRLRDLRSPPDLVIIAAATGEAVLDDATEAAAVGAKALLVLPADHQDEADASREHEQELLTIVRSAGMRMVGPNSVGVINTALDVALNATQAGTSPIPGGLAICSPSGAVGIGLLGYAAARKLGISIFASLGLRSDVSTNDLLEFWEEDDRTVAAILYAETFGNPEHFARIAQRVCRKKPILAVKGRRRVPSRRDDTRSDTAAALRGDTVVDALLRQAGVLRFGSGEELFNAAEFFERQPLPEGRRIGIITNSSGVATLATDACLGHGLELGVAADVSNPWVLEIGSGSDAYAAAVAELLADSGIDALSVHFTDRRDGDAAAVLAAVSSACAGHAKPVVASMLESGGRLPDPSDSAVPNFLFLESCAMILARAAQRREWLSRPLGDPPAFADIDRAAARAVIDAFTASEPAEGWLAIAEAEALLASHGIPFVPSRPCREPDQAAAAAARIGAPVVVSAAVAPPSHAGDIGAVLLGLEGESAVRSGWRELERRVGLAGREFEGAIVQRLAPSGGDVLVGAVFDPELGLVMAVGLGGRHAGLDRTAAFRLLPSTDAEADELIDSSGAVATELDGYRGAPALDRVALRELILRFALLLREVPEMVEADLNPVRCTTAGCEVLEARIRIAHRPTHERVKTW